MQRNLSIVLELACVIACAYFLAAAANVLLLPGVAVGPRQAQAAVAPAPAAPPPPRSTFDPILSRNLFDIYVPPAPQPKEKTVTEIPVSALGSKLIGTIYSNDLDIRRAIVQIGPSQSLLKVGESVEGLVIKEILRRAVVLDRGGKDELLLIDGNDATVALQATRQSTVSRKWFKEQLKDLAHLVKGIQLDKADYGDKKGILVQQLAEDSIFKGMGLKTGDMLLKVNNEPLFNYRSPLEALNLLNKSDEVKIDLWRIDKVITLTFNMVE